MEILQKDRILTKIFPSDIAIITNLYTTDYIAPNNIKHCEANIDYYTKYRNETYCKLYTNDLKKRLSKFDKYPELQNLTKFINMVNWTHVEIEECIMTRVEIKTCNLRLIRYEHMTNASYYFECGMQKNNFNDIDDVIDVIYSTLNFKYVPTYIFCDYLISIFDLMLLSVL